MRERSTKGCFHWTDPKRPELVIEALQEKNWPDFLDLFGEKGACGGCWCMNWRLPAREFNAHKGEGNREAMKALVVAGKKPGLLGFLEGKPVAWCSVGPRNDFPRLEKTRILQPVDDQPVWSIVCLFVAKNARRQGISTSMLRAACGFVAASGGSLVEGYPFAPDKPDMPPPFVWTGLESAFLKAGFHEVARRSASRPIMRRTSRD